MSVSESVFLMKASPVLSAALPPSVEEHHLGCVGRGGGVTYLPSYFREVVCP